MHHYLHDQVCRNHHLPMTKPYLSQTKRQIKACDKVKMLNNILWIKNVLKIQAFGHLNYNLQQAK